METRIQAESDPKARATTNVSMSVLNQSKGLCVILKAVRAPGAVRKFRKAKTVQSNPSSLGLIKDCIISSGSTYKMLLK